MAAITVVGLLIVGSLLNAFDEFYARLPVANRVPIKSYVQIAKIVLFQQVQHVY